MTAASDLAELSTLRATLDDVAQRVEAVADAYRETQNSAVSSDLDGAWRALFATRRSIDRALGTLESLTA